MMYVCAYPHIASPQSMPPDKNRYQATSVTSLPKEEYELSDMDRHVESCPRKNSPLETDLARLSQ